MMDTTAILLPDLAANAAIAAPDVLSWWQALLLGLIQGLTEFLPVSSSGHLELGKELLNIHTTDDLMFTVCLHGATVLSTLVVFGKDILKLFSGLFKFLAKPLLPKEASAQQDRDGACTCTLAKFTQRLNLNPEADYVFKLILSMVPIAFVGVFFKDQIEGLFGNGVRLVGIMLLVTAALLALAQWLGQGRHEVRYKDAFIIGLAQAVAVLPGLSRSGTTIATGLLLGTRKEEVARFSFLMVLVPILGENLLCLLEGDLVQSAIPLSSLLVGSLTAFISGWAACKWMIRIVSRGKIIYFAIYCAIVGLLAVVL